LRRFIENHPEVGDELISALNQIERSTTKNAKQKLILFSINSCYKFDDIKNNIKNCNKQLYYINIVLF